MATNFLGSQQTGTQTATTAIDPDIKQAYINQILLSNAVAARPYQQYEGPTVAPFSADQLAAFQGVRQNAQGPMNFLQGNMQAYQNPYTQQVIDTTMGDLDRARQLQQQQVNAQALSRGAYGGSRQAVAEAENNRNFMDQQARTAAQLRNQGFENAAARMNLDINRSQNALGQLMQTGGMQQQQVQSNYNAARDDFNRQFNYPLQQLQIRQSALANNPSAFGTTTSQPVFENKAANLAGLALAGTGIINNLGGFNNVTSGFSNFLSGLNPFSR